MELTEINVQHQLVLMKAKKKLYDELQIKIKCLIRSVTKLSDDYDENM